MRKLGWVAVSASFVLSSVVAACVGDDPSASSPDNAGDAGDAGANGGETSLPQTDSGNDGASGPLTVSGHVVDVGLYPVPGAIVVIDGKTTTTDVTGAFSIGITSVPYTMSIVQTESISTYVGLTSKTPAVHIDYVGAGSQLGNIKLTAPVSGDEIPLAGNNVIIGVVPTAAVRTSHAHLGSAANALGGTPMTWYSPDGNLSADIYAFVTSSDQASIYSYGNISAFSFLPNDGGAATSPTINVTDVIGTVAISGTYTLPAGFTLSSNGPCNIHPPNQFGFGVGSTTATTFTCAVPSLLLLTWKTDVIIEGTDANGNIARKTTRVPSATSTLALAALTPSLVTVPTAASIDVDGTKPVLWSSPTSSGQVHRVSLELGQLNYLIYTTENSAAAPDLSAAGVVPSTNHEGAIQIYDYDGLNVDNFVDGTDVVASAGGVSSQVTFTTK